MKDGRQENVAIFICTQAQPTPWRILPRDNPIVSKDKQQTAGVDLDASNHELNVDES